MDDLINEIESKIHNFKCKNRRQDNPEFILMHPNTFDSLFDFMFKIGINYILPYNVNKPKYKDIKIIRSFDLEENEIIVK